MEYIKIPLICTEAVLALADAERGRLLKAVLQYVTTGSAVEPCGSERGLYLVLKSQMDADKAGAEHCSMVRADAGRKGGLAKSSNAKQTLANPSTPSLPSSPPIPPLSPNPTPKEKPPKGGKKKAPTLEEVEAYCLERNNGIDPQAFIDFYTARGWKYGQGKPVVDWKAAVRTWEHRRKAEQTVDQHIQPSGPRKFHTEIIDGEEVVVYDN